MCSDHISSDVDNKRGPLSPERIIMKKFLFFSGDTTYELELAAIEKRFEIYLLYKASTAEGVAWLKEFQLSGTQTIALIMHFLYDRDWIDTVVEHHEDELIHFLSPVKVKIFKKLF